MLDQGRPAIAFRSAVASEKSEWIRDGFVLGGSLRPGAKQKPLAQVWQSRSPLTDATLAGLACAAPFRANEPKLISQSQPHGAKTGWLARNRTLLAAGSAASVLVLLSTARHANAQSADQPSGDGTLASSIEGVQSVQIGSDGAARLILEDGSALVLPEGSFTLSPDGEVLLSDAALAQITAATGAAGGSGLMAGLAGLGGIGLAAGALGSGSSGASATTPSASTSGAVVDGYVMNATVFRDLNDNGVLDVGEPNSITDASGNFLLDEGASVDTSAKIIAFGGTDISTGKPFVGQLSAPGDSGVVTPLTTLVQARIEATGVDADTAVAEVATALGLAGQDLRTLDPIVEADTGNTDALKAAAKVATVISLAAADAEDAEAASEAAATALADGLADSGAGALDDATVLEAAFTDAATAGGATTSDSTSATARAAAAASANAAITAAADTDDIALVQEVVQGDLLDDVAAGEDVSAVDVAAAAAALVPLRPMVEAFDQQLDASEVPAGLILSGTGRVGTTVRVEIGGFSETALVQAPATEGEPGTWSLTIAADDLPEGMDLTLDIRATEDAEATTPSFSLARSFEMDIDATPPEAASDLSIAENDLVNAEEHEAARLTGTAEPGASLRVTLDGGSSSTAEVGSDGQFSIAFSELTEGAHSVEVVVVDALGNESAAITHDFSVDTVAPDAPAGGFAASIDNVVNASDGATFLVSGQAEAGATLVLTFNGARQETEIPANGAFEVQFGTPADGNYPLTAVVTDAAGNESPAATLDVLVEASLVVPPSQGVVAEDGVVNAAEAADFTVTGRADQGTTVALTLGESTQTTSPGTDGRFEFQITGAALGEGAQNLQLTATDARGNVSEVGNLPFLVDTNAPSSPTGGIVSDDNLVTAADRAQGFFQVSGQAEANSTITAQFTGQTFETIANAGGEFTIDVMPVDPAEGANSLTLTASDPAGNASPEIALPFTIDTEGPAAPTTLAVSGDGIVTSEDRASDAFEVTGLTEAEASVLVSFGSVTTTGQADATGAFAISVTPDNPMEGANSLTVQATDTAGNLGEAATVNFLIDTEAPLPASGLVLSQDNLVTTTDLQAGQVLLAGQTDPEAEVLVQAFGQEAIGQADSSGNFEIGLPLQSLPSAIPLEGEAVLTVQTRDAYGNAGDPVPLTFRVDALAPNAPQGIAVSQDDLVTQQDHDRNFFTVTGEADPDSQVVVTFGEIRAEATADGAGAFTLSLTPADPDQGLNTLTVQSIDAAGNVSPIIDHSFMIDTQPPAPATDIAISMDNLITSQDERLGHFSVTGRAEPDATVLIIFDQHSVEGQVGPDGQFQIDLSPEALPQGPNSLSVQTRDPAGNLSDAITHPFDIDSQAPAAPDLSGLQTTISAADRATWMFEGSTEPDVTIEVSLNGGSVGTFLSNGQGQFQVPDLLNGLGDGSHEVSLVLRDPALNQSEPFSLTLSLDTTGPDIADLRVSDDNRVADDEEGAVEISGQTEPGAIVALNVAGIPLTSVVADSTGHFTAIFQEAFPEDVDHLEVQAQAQDGLGNLGAPFSTQAYPEHAPSAPVILSPTGDAVVAPFTASGTGEPGARLFLDINGSEVETTVDASGHWDIEIAPDVLGTDLGETYTLSARQVPEDGPSSPPSASVIGNIVDVLGTVTATIYPIDGGFDFSEGSPFEFLLTIVEAANDLGLEPEVNDAGAVTFLSGPGRIELTGEDLGLSTPDMASSGDPTSDLGGTITGLRLFYRSDLALEFEGLEVDAAAFQRALTDAIALEPDDQGDPNPDDPETGTGEDEIPNTRSDEGSGDQPQDGPESDPGSSDPHESDEGHATGGPHSDDPSDDMHGPSDEGSPDQGLTEEGCPPDHNHPHLNAQQIEDLLIGDRSLNIAIEGSGPVTLNLSRFDDTVAGGSGANALFGGDGWDRLSGEEGADLLQGGEGSDTLQGGDGQDTASYIGEETAVSVDLLIGTAAQGTDLDDLSGIEHLFGSEADDHLAGDHENNSFYGGAGSDTLDGRDGIDTVFFSLPEASWPDPEADDRGGMGPEETPEAVAPQTDAPLTDAPEPPTAPDPENPDDTVEVSGVLVDLDGETAIDLSRATDTLLNIENVTGSDRDDWIQGDDAANILIGAAGDDTLIGGAEADTLTGGQGRDFFGIEGHDVLTDFTMQEDQLGGAADAMTREEIESAVAQGADTIMADSEGQMVDAFVVRLSETDSITFQGWTQDSFVLALNTAHLSHLSGDHDLFEIYAEIQASTEVQATLTQDDEQDALRLEADLGDSGRFALVIEGEDFVLSDTQLMGGTVTSLQLFDFSHDTGDDTGSPNEPPMEDSPTGPDGDDTLPGPGEMDGPGTNDPEEGSAGNDTGEGDDGPDAAPPSENGQPEEGLHSGGGPAWRLDNIRVEAALLNEVLVDMASGDPTGLVDLIDAPLRFEGSPAAETLTLGDEDDLLIGNGGADILDGGMGDDTLIAGHHHSAEHESCPDGDGFFPSPEDSGEDTVEAPAEHPSDDPAGPTADDPQGGTAEDGIPSGDLGGDLGDNPGDDPNSDAGGHSGDDEGSDPDTGSGGPDGDYGPGSEWEHEETILIYSGGHDVFVGVNFDDVLLEFSSEFDSETQIIAALSGAVDVSTEFGDGVQLSFDEDNSLVLVGISSDQMDLLAGSRGHVFAESLEPGYDPAVLLVAAFGEGLGTPAIINVDAQSQSYNFTAEAGEDLFAEVNFDDDGGVTSIWFHDADYHAYAEIWNLGSLPLETLATNAIEVAEDMRSHADLFGLGTPVSFIGHDGDDIYDFAGGTETPVFVAGEAGNDWLIPTEGAALIQGGPGEDLIAAALAEVTILLDLDENEDPPTDTDQQLDLIIGFGADDRLAVFDAEGSLDLGVAVGTVDDVSTLSDLALFAMFLDMDAPGDDLNMFFVSDDDETELHISNGDFTERKALATFENLDGIDAADLVDGLVLLTPQDLPPMS